jgi:ABC-2 type transport system ATP-binding protein
MTTGKVPGDGVVLSRLCKSYGQVRAVRPLDLAIPPGETVAILGPNGAGKTTVLDMMLGLTRPDSGSVSLFGMPPARAAKAGIISGMLQTGVPVDHLRVRELLTMVASLYPRPLKVDDVLRLTGATAFAGRQTNRLSGGQVQRVRFGVALVANADLLVLDEPTAAIDVEGRREFWDAMRQVAAEGKTVIFATHYLEEADAYADRIVLLAQGRIVADGPATEIKAKVIGLPTVWLIRRLSNEHVTFTFEQQGPVTEVRVCPPRWPRQARATGQKPFGSLTNEAGSERSPTLRSTAARLTRGAGGGHDERGAVRRRGRRPFPSGALSGRRGAHSRAVTA